MPDISIAIKTFERKECLVNLLRSIDSLGYTYPILIADDSRTPYKDIICKQFLNLPIDYRCLPFDRGASFGRNYLLKQIETEYFVLCDDDFYFDAATDLELAKTMLLEHHVDLLGGTVYNYRTIRRPLDRAIRWLLGILGIRRPFTWTAADFHFEDDTIRIDFKRRKLHKFLKTDLIANFFIARTEAVRALGGWEERFKWWGEHQDLFIRAKQHGTRIGYTQEFSVRHYSVEDDKYATVVRNAKTASQAIYQEYIKERYGVNRIIVTIEGQPVRRRTKLMQVLSEFERKER